MGVSMHEVGVVRSFLLCGYKSGKSLVDKARAHYNSLYLARNKRHPNLSSVGPSSAFLGRVAPEQCTQISSMTNDLVLINNLLFAFIDSNPDHLHSAVQIFRNSLFDFCRVARAAAYHVVGIGPIPIPTDR